MQRKTQTIVLLLGFCAMTVVAGASDLRRVDQEFMELDEDVKVVAQRYLQADCAIGGSQGEFLQQLLDVGLQARGYLEAVRAEGPPRQVLRELEKKLDMAWTAMQAFLSTDLAHVAGGDAYEEMASITREDYMETQLEAIDAGYRESADLALTALSSGACFGKVPTIVGTSGDDYISGTVGDDVIVGLGGNDVIFGRGGHDIVCGGIGDDRITTRDGNDQISGGDDRDTIVSGAGSDLVLGGDGGDNIDGGDDSDRLKGEDGADVIAGGAGDDTLIGGAGRDTLDGGSGSDSCLDGENTSSCP